MPGSPSVASVSRWKIPSARTSFDRNNTQCRLFYLRLGHHALRFTVDALDGYWLALEAANGRVGGCRPHN
jgi:hypothetical protein